MIIMLMAMMMLFASMANATARYGYKITNTAGVGQTGKTVTLYRYAGDVLIGTFTEVGNGLYYIDHTLTEKVYIKVDGVLQTGTNGMMFPADDMATTTTLNSSAAGKGASTVKIQDAGGWYTLTTVEGALQEAGAFVYYLPSVLGAGMVGVRDVGGYYAGSYVEDALQELGPAKSLSATTATASEITQVCDGVSDSVTAAHLNDLCDRTSITDLHRHSMDQLDISFVGPHYQSDPTQTHFTVYSGYAGEYNGSGPKGNIYLNTYDADGSGNVYVQRGNDADVQTDYLVTTSQQFGSGNYSSLGFFNGITNMTDAILRLGASYQAQASQPEVRSVIIYNSGTSDSACTRPDTTVKWHTTGTESGICFLRQAFVCEYGMKYITMDYYAKMDSGDDAKTILYAGGEYAEGSIVGTTWKDYQLTVVLPTVTADSLMTAEFQMYVTADQVYVSEWIVIRASQ